MTLSPDDLAAMGERHVAETRWRFGHLGDPDTPYEVCEKDGEPWPCDSRRLLDEVEALRELATEERERHDFHHGIAHQSHALSEEVMTQTANEPST